MTRTALLSVCTMALAATLSAPAPGLAQARNTLDIYVPDTEGGGATLLVTPTGESVLIDTGFPGDRDHDRIMEVIKAAGLSRIDHLISTHYHVDHVGGVQQLAEALPIGHYIDHGPSVEEREQVQGFQAAYAELYGAATHTVVAPGDTLEIAGLEWTILASAGNTIGSPLPGAGQDNAAACSASEVKPLLERDPENAMSVGSLIRFGEFSTVHLGDLYWAKELELMCPVNRVGTVDLYLVSHHGSDQSGSPALVHGLQPRVAVMQNGTRKGGAAEVMRTILTSPGMEDLWALHWSYNAKIDLNPPGLFIANVDEDTAIADVLTAPPPAPRGGGGPQGGRMGQAPGAGRQGAGGAVTPGPGRAGAPGGAQAGRGGRGGRGAGPAGHTPAHYIKISASEDGSFSVTNSRNGVTKSYAAH